MESVKYGDMDNTQRRLILGRMEETGLKCIHRSQKKYIDKKSRVLLSTALGREYVDVWIARRVLLF